MTDSKESLIGSPPDGAVRRQPENGWTMLGVTPCWTQWQKGYYCALSSLVNVYDEHQPAHWEWLISFSNQGRKRLSNQEIAICLKDFGAEGFVEDNHEPGVARKFWMAVKEKYRVPCPCQDEMVIVEGDYKYSVKKDDAHVK
jgi:hypothetical protein